MRHIDSSARPAKRLIGSQKFKASHGEPARNAAGLQALFEKTVIAANKQRLAVARAGVAADRRAASTGATALVDIAEARRHCRAAGLELDETVRIPHADRFFIKDPDGNRIEVIHWERAYDPAAE